jgi:hypothetical protein
MSVKVRGRNCRSCVCMRLSAIRANGLDLPWNGPRKESVQLAQTPNPIDSVHLSPEAQQASQHHIAESLSVKSEMIRAQIAELAMDQPP